MNDFEYGDPVVHAAMLPPQEQMPAAIDSGKYNFCHKPLDCGCQCKGVQGDTVCIPCQSPEHMEPESPALEPQDMVAGVSAQVAANEPAHINARDTYTCQICLNKPLAQIPCVTLLCKHVYHAECVDRTLTSGCLTKRITMDFMACPQCKEVFEMGPNQEPSALASQLVVCRQEMREVESKVLAICMKEGLDKHEKVMARGDVYFNKPVKFMLEKATLYNCHDCRKIYFGGMNDSEKYARENMSAENFLCKTCAEKALGYGKEFCELHGNEFTDFKCQYCCSIALFVSDNGTKFHRQPCFNDMMEKRIRVKTSCTGGENCAMGISAHPKGPAKYALGCSLCRSEKLSFLVREKGRVVLVSTWRIEVTCSKSTVESISLSAIG